MDYYTTHSRYSSPKGDIAEITTEKRGDTAAAAAVLYALYGCVTLGGPYQVR